MTSYFRRYTKQMVGVTMGINNLLELFNEKYYENLDGGILDSRHRAVKDTISLWDVLALDTSLVGTTYGSRYKRLLDATDGRFIVDGFDFGAKLTDKIFVPDMLGPDDWNAKWDWITAVNKHYGYTPSRAQNAGSGILEGLYFKLSTGILEPATKIENNTSWSVRTRITTRRHQQ